jgi:hypothetical protein
VYFRFEAFLEVLNSNSNSNLLRIAAVFALENMCFVRGFEESVFLRFVEILLCEENREQSFVVIKEVLENLIKLLDFVSLDKVLWIIKNNCFVVLERILVFEESLEDGIMTKVGDLLCKFLSFAEVSGCVDEFVESFERWNGFEVIERIEDRGYSLSGVRNVLRRDL